MTNTFMAEFYATKSAEVDQAKAAKDNLALCRTEEVANFVPTPTAAELNTVMGGGSVTLAAPVVTPNRIMRPAAAQFYAQKKFPTRT